VLQCGVVGAAAGVAECSSAQQRVAACCDVLNGVAVCVQQWVLQCVAMCCVVKCGVLLQYACSSGCCDRNQ